MRHFDHVDLFDFIVTQEDVVNKKPHPECFQIAMAHFDALPKDTIIFEDSDFGIKAVLASGAGICQVLDYINH